MANAWAGQIFESVEYIRAMLWLFSWLALPATGINCLTRFKVSGPYTLSTISQVLCLESVMTLSQQLQRKMW